MKEELDQLSAFFNFKSVYAYGRQKFWQQTRNSSESNKLANILDEKTHNNEAFPTQYAP